MQRCPRAVAKSCALLPYFLEYKRSNYIAWPDGKGMYYQPIKLVQAFGILNYYFKKFEDIKIEEGKKKPSLKGLEELEQKTKEIWGMK